MVNKKITALMALLAVGVTVFLVGCSAISTGYIMKKHYVPAHTDQTYECAMWTQKYDKYSKSYTNQCSWYHWVDHYIEAEYTFDLKKGKDTGWVNVDSTDYHKYAVGDYFGDDQYKVAGN